MENLEFTKKDTAIIKGVAIICMFMHHLFAFPDRIKAGSSYISLFSMSGIGFEILLGAFGKICVAMFLFLSGFRGLLRPGRREGLFKNMRPKSTKKIKKRLQSPLREFFHPQPICSIK